MPITYHCSLCKRKVPSTSYFCLGTTEYSFLKEIEQRIWETQDICKLCKSEITKEAAIAAELEHNRIKTTGQYKNSTWLYFKIWLIRTFW